MLTGHCNVFPEVLLRLKSQKVKLCFGYIIEECLMSFCCGIICSTVYSCQLWKHLDKAGATKGNKFKMTLFTSENMLFSFPYSFSYFSFPLPPCIIPLVMCQCNFGVQDMSSLQRMCFFLYPIWAPLLWYSRTFFSSFHFIEHITSISLYHHHNVTSFINPRVTHLQLLNWKTRLGSVHASVYLIVKVTCFSLLLLTELSMQPYITLLYKIYILKLIGQSTERSLLHFMFASNQ